jgi:hypothetical protein
LRLSPRACRQVAWLDGGPTGAAACHRAFVHRAADKEPGQVSAAQPVARSELL